MTSTFYNPWAVESLENFLYYCCPECDMKNTSREEFLEHALNQHPLVKECLPILTGVKQELFEYPHPEADNLSGTEYDSNMNDDTIMKEDDSTDDIKPYLLDDDSVQIKEEEATTNADMNFHGVKDHFHAALQQKGC